MASQEAPAPDEAHIYVERVIVRNFRGIEYLDLKLERDVTVLVGPNNVGKSRVIRALALVLAAASPDDDDIQEGAEPATVDVFLAPDRPNLDAEDAFGNREGQRLGKELVQAVSDDPFVERAAWRLKLSRPEGAKRVRADFHALTYDMSTKVWGPRVAVAAAGHNRAIVAGELILTGRDIADDLGRRGSPIQRMLRDLGVDAGKRAEVEQSLEALGTEIAAESSTIRDLAASLRQLEGTVDFLGQPSVRPLPATLEELARSVSVDVDTGQGSLPVRFHGAGTRSLAAIQVQSAVRSNRDLMEGELRPRDLVLVEEPEAHLHPQAQFDLPRLFERLRGQIVTSTHSSHLVTSVEPRAIRILRRGTTGQIRVLDFAPVDEGEYTEDRARRPQLHAVEMEKIRTLIERPFGELLFATAIVIGDGATERGLLPPLLRSALGPAANGVCVVDPGSMNNTYAIAIAKFANLLEIPWVLFADGDPAGQKAVKKLLDVCGRGDADRVAWVSEAGSSDHGATERMILEFDRAISIETCARLGCDLAEDASDHEILVAQKSLKGSQGRVMASVVLEKYPVVDSNVDHWPKPFLALIEKLKARLA